MRMPYIQLPTDAPAPLAALRCGHVLGDALLAAPGDAICSTCTDQHSSIGRAFPAMTAYWMRLLHNLRHCRLLDRPAAMATLLAEWSSLLAELPAGSPYTTAAASLIAQLSIIEHVSTGPHCVAALVGLLRFLAALDAF